MSKFLNALDYEPIPNKYREGRQVYILTAPLKYYSDIVYHEHSDLDLFDDGVIVVPVGFKTDFASIPWPFFYIIDPKGPWMRAACVHDYILKVTKDFDAVGFKRKVCDDIFYEAMRTDGINRIVSLSMWCYVRLYSQFK
jgi:hypothetical protein